MIGNFKQNLVENRFSVPKTQIQTRNSYITSCDRNSCYSRQCTVVTFLTECLQQNICKFLTQDLEQEKIVSNSHVNSLLLCNQINNMLTISGFLPEKISGGRQYAIISVVLSIVFENFRGQ